MHRPRICSQHTAARPCRASSGDPKFEQMLTEVRHQLSVKGAGPDVQAYVEQLLLERHQSYNSYMTAEADKRRILLDHVSKLEVLSYTYKRTWYPRDVCAAQ